jgi:hypothetical protein
LWKEKSKENSIKCYPPFRIDLQAVQAAA